MIILNFGKVGFKFFLLVLGKECKVVSIYVLDVLVKGNRNCWRVRFGWNSKV